MWKQLKILSPVCILLLLSAILPLQLEAGTTHDTSDSDESDDSPVTFITKPGTRFLGGPCEYPIGSWLLKYQNQQMCIRRGHQYLDTCYFLNGHLFKEKDLFSWGYPKCNDTSLHCEPEPFEHLYQQRDGKLQHFRNHWSRARAGQQVGLNRVCLKPNGLPLVRRCVFNKTLYKAEWEKLNVTSNFTCLLDIKEPIMSSRLNDLFVSIQNGSVTLNSTRERKQALSEVRAMFTQRNKQIIPTDVFLTSEILKSATQDEVDVAISSDVVSLCNNMMGVEQKTLQISAELNSTNEFLAAFESYFDSVAGKMESELTCTASLDNQTATDLTGNVDVVDLGEEGVRVYLSDNLIVFVVNPNCSNIAGIALYSDSAQSVLNRSVVKSLKYRVRYRFIYLNETADDKGLTEEEDLEVAGYLPSTLWADLKSKNQLKMLAFKVYTHDSLFVERSLIRNRKPSSKILSISLIGFEGTLSENFIFVLKSQHSNITDLPNAQKFSGCGYWNYQTWVNDGVETLSNDSYNQNIVKCGTKHFTPFSFLLGGSYKQNDFSDSIVITPVHDTILDYISLIGCALSLLGLFGIVLTAALFKRWRQLPSTKILLNLCAALFLQMVLFVFVNTDSKSEELILEGNYDNCIVLGALMQYSILVLFCWMLIAALLQFQRYVTVIGSYKPDHYILKSAAVAWCLPLIPTLIVALVAPHSYIPTSYQLATDTGICYPSGAGLHYGVILPIVIILIANTVVFVHVIWSASHTLKQSSRRHERKMVFQQIRLYVLLVFLFGLTWIFGVLAFMKAGLAFSYLFCITATTQGFVLFIYLVVLNKTSQECWRNLCKSKEKYHINTGGNIFDKCCASMCGEKKKRQNEVSSLTNNDPRGGAGGNENQTNSHVIEELSSTIIEERK